MKEKIRLLRDQQNKIYTAKQNNELYNPAQTVTSGNVMLAYKYLNGVNSREEKGIV